MAAVALLLIATSLLMGCTNLVVAGDDSNKVFHVDGKVLCQDCTKGYKEWVLGATPIKGCVVSLTCMDERKKVMYYVSDMTDERGQFDMTVNKYNYGKELKANLCSVRLVSSPHPTCHIPTNFAGGETGVKLRRPTLMYRDLIKYTVGPFYYTTPMCEKPDTNGGDQESNY